MRHKMTNQRKRFVIENFAYRMSIKYPTCVESIGAGNIQPRVVVVHPQNRFADKDPVVGALKKFNLLEETFRTTSNLIPGQDYKVNNYYLVEFIQLLDPDIVVLCGPEALGTCRRRIVRNFNRYSGRTLDIPQLSGKLVYCAINPFDYGASYASTELKASGKQDWNNICELYNSIENND